MNVSRRDFLKAMVVATAATALPVQAVMAEEEAPMEELDFSNVKEVYDTDVLVIGAGSGMFAAVVTSRAGLKTTVIAKCESCVNTNTNIIGGTTGGDTKQCEEDGKVTPQDQVFAHMMDFGQGTVNSRLVRNCLAGASKALDCWKDLGCQMMVGADRYGVGFESVHVYMSRNKSQLLEDEVIANGGTCMYGLDAKELIMDGDAVVGAYAVNEDGEVLQFNAKKVLVACGGFLDNAEMMNQYYGIGQKVGKFRFAINDGAGIKMALKAGAIMDTNFSIGSLADATGFNEKIPDIMSSYFFGANQALCFHNVGCMLVDNHGERFFNEYMFANEPLAYGGAITTRIGYYYAIVDQACVDKIQEEGIYNRLGRPAQWSVGALLFDTPKENLNADLETAIEQGWAWKGETPEELAEASGLTHVAEEIAKWNEFCANGKDEDLLLDPAFLIPLEQGPYYAIEYQCGGLNTMGGIKTDNTCHALNGELNAIPNLFVGSSDNGSVFSSPYYNVGGTCSGMCFGTCWVAGEQMVKELTA